MPPNQYQFPAPPPQQPEHNPYGFFMEPPKPQRQLFGGSPLKKYGLLAAILAVVLILIVIIISLATGGNDNNATLLGIAQKQQELIRVAADGAKNSKNTSITNFAATTQVSLSSAQQDIIGYMAKRGAKVNDKTLALGRDAQTDKALGAALAANTYDTTFTSVMQSDLTTYKTALDNARTTAATKTEQDLLKQQVTNAELLGKMLVAQ